ncbi:DotU/TssL family secretion system protein [Sorangium sp. So ce1036]|uniref:DotU family type IV/VI secretion system protein n=1 Tax=Sorangium sp. So ce1036 TaxID=3133328 RepID=UPI003F06F508
MTERAATVVDAPRWEAPSPLDGSPAQGLAGSTLLLDAFHDFYAQVVSQREEVTRPHGGRAPSVERVRQRLADFLSAQHEGLDRKLGRKLANHERQLYEEAQYVMTAMADEVLLQAEWDGRHAWAERPLEAHVFHTCNSGESIFHKLEDVLDERDPAPSALLLVYLAALALGFQGKFRALGQHDAPEEYRQRLALHLQRVDPALSRALTQLCPQAHAHTAGGSPRSRLPSLRAGVLPLAAVVICLVLAAQVVWAFRVADVVEALDRIEGAS